MQNSRDVQGSRESRLNAVLASYLELLEQGDEPSLTRWLADHDEFRDELNEFVREWRQFSTAASTDERRASPPAAPAGFRDFEIIRELGRGGMGVVYEARQVSLDRQVALKMLPSWALLDRRHLQRFQNEARAAARLHHPHIVPVFAIGSEQGTHYFAMQLIEGCSLRQVLEELRSQPSRFGHEPDGEAIEPAAETNAGALLTVDLSGTQGRRYYRSVAQLGAVAADALEHAHQCGVIHRDIKPANLLLEHNGHLWVSDFGLAAIQGLDSLTETGDLLGTLLYMSPEQASSGRGVDERADVYSLGMTLYELVALRPAFIAKDRAALLRQVLHDDPPPPSKFNPRVPRDLETVILTAIAKEPGDRYASAQALADDLRNFMAGLPLAAKRPTLSKRATRWSRRHPAWVLSSLATALVVTAMATFWSAYALRSVRGARSVVSWDSRPLELDEGSSYTMDASRLAGEDIERASRMHIDWGDGHKQDFRIDVVANHAYADGPAEHSLQVDFLSRSGEVLGTRRRQIAVRNVPPVVDIRWAEIAYVGKGVLMKLGRTYDPGEDVILGLTVDWDDTHQGTYRTPATPIHTYDAPREATVRVTAEDDDGVHVVGTSKLHVLAANARPELRVVSSEWKLARSIPFDSGMGAFVHPRDGNVYVVRVFRENFSRRVSNAEEIGLFQLGSDGHPRRIFNAFFINFAAPHPVTGDLFVQHSHPKLHVKLTYGTWQETPWAGNLRSGDIDASGFAITPPDYRGGVTGPLHAVIADRGHDSPREILGFSAEAQETNKQRLHVDQHILVEPLDVAASRDDIYVVDFSGGGDNTGRVLRMLPGGSLEPIALSGIGRPVGVAVTADNSALLLADVYQNRVLQVDLRTHAVTDIIVGLGIGDAKEDDLFMANGCVRLSSDERTLVITDRGRGAIILLERQD